MRRMTISGSLTPSERASAHCSIWVSMRSPDWSRCLGRLSVSPVSRATFDKPTELEDVATLVLEMESGGIVTAETSWCDPARTWGASIHGTAGKLTLPGEDGAALSQWTPTSYTRETAPVDLKAIDCSDADLGDMHAHFAECIRDGQAAAAVARLRSAPCH